MLLSGLTLRACARSSEDGTYEEAEGSDGEQMLTWAMELPDGYSWIFEVNITKADDHDDGSVSHFFVDLDDAIECYQEMIITHWDSLEIRVERMMREVRGIVI